MASSMVQLFLFTCLFLGYAKSRISYFENNTRVETEDPEDAYDDEPLILQRFDFYNIKIRNEIPIRKVDLDIFYEPFCPYSIRFDITRLIPLLYKIGSDVNIRMYPYGNANTTVFPNGTFAFSCQHGPAECYGSKLHACALDIIDDYTAAIIFNGCMIGLHSDDQSADTCGVQQHVDADQVQQIKDCAQSEYGDKLLYEFGVKSKQAGFKHVPYVLVNGKEFRGDDLMKKVFEEMGAKKVELKSSFQNNRDGSQV